MAISSYNSFLPTLVHFVYSRRKAVSLWYSFNGFPCLILFYFWSFTPVAYGNSWDGIKLELQLRPMPQPQQCWIWASSVTYAASCGNDRSLIHWVRPGVKLTCSRRGQVLNLLSHDGNSNLLCSSFYHITMLRSSDVFFRYRTTFHWHSLLSVIERLQWWRHLSSDLGPDIFLWTTEQVTYFLSTPSLTLLCNGMTNNGLIVRISEISRNCFHKHISIPGTSLEI